MKKADSIETESEGENPLAGTSVEEATGSAPQGRESGRSATGGNTRAKGVTFEEFIAAHGIIAPVVITPGRWQRTATVTHPNKRNGSIKLGEDGTHGFAIDFSSMTESALWTAHGLENIRRERTAEENAALSRKLAEKRTEEKRGIMRANALYGTARALLHGDHDYCRKKNLTMEGCRGLRVDEKGWLIVPMLRDGKVMSVQRISPDGEKRFSYGCPTKWTQYRIHRPGSVITVLCEGLATGITVFQAMSNADVIICFTAGNLVAVSERESLQGMVAIAGDNDWGVVCHRHLQYGEINVFDPESPRPAWCKCNPGKTDAIIAAKNTGCGYAIPSGTGTDWNDVFSENMSALQKADESSNYPAHPATLRNSALAPIRAEIMKAMRFVKKPCSSTT